MIDAVGRVMLYVKDPRSVADFWINTVGFVEIEQQPAPDNTLMVEIAPAKQADTTLVLYSRDVIAKYEPELTLGTPSILFSSRNLKELHKKLAAKGVKVGEIVEIQGMQTFNFPDTEGNYFAVRQIG